MSELSQSEKIVNSTTSQELLPPSTKEQRQANWRIMQERLSKVTDALGNPIDEGIMEPVVGLNLLNLNTIQSCAGHADNTQHGKAYPWIDVGGEPTEEIDRLYEMAKEASKRNNEGASLEARDAAWKERKGIADKIKAVSMKQTIEESKKLLLQLQEFYANRQTPIEQRLVVTYLPDGSAARLQPQGAELQEIHDQATKERLLINFQEEMASFSAFLKSRYIGE